ncbi:uncharacterized protein [Choristoneura fumiferana]|uniref:uncharacterized protein n=1 Tax=Choristoneura fumiferana TaxID=7141 RepID=UPI003D15D497
MAFEITVDSLRVILILVFLVPLEGVTVKPVRCPTNKIAPHRRSAYFNQIGSRTFGGAFYDLLSPNGGPAQHDSLGNLQEKPQEDDPDDCGDIEDYDETDLSSLYQPYSHRRGHNDNRFFFGGLFGNRPNPGQTTHDGPVTRPTTYMPTPPYWSGGYFGNNHYRPPLHQEPSDGVKPVHEGPHEGYSTYRPDIVGGPIGHVVGHSPVRPTTRPQETTTQKRLHYHTRYPPRTTEAVHTTRPSRPRAYNDGIFSSFVDLLLFK